MPHPRSRPVATACALVIATAFLAACGGGSDPASSSAPQLSPATPASFAGDCVGLAAALAGIPDTTITATTTVAAGTLSVGGQAVAEHPPASE